jgi:hypothetical protein
MLMELTQNRAGNQRRAMDAGVIDALVALLRRVTGATPPDLVSQALSLLDGGTLDCPATTQHAGRLGAVEAVVAAMRTHSGDCGVQAAGCLALSSLVRDNSGNMAAALRAGAMTVTQAAMRTVGDTADEESLEQVRELLAALQQGEATRSDAADAAMAALLADEQAERAAQSAAALKAKSKSGKKKKKGGGNGSGSGNGGGTERSAAAPPEAAGAPAAAAAATPVAGSQAGDEAAAAAAASTSDALLRGAAAAGTPSDRQREAASGACARAAHTCGCCTHT